MKILIVRFSSIGDIVLTTPVVRCLKQQTGATIHYLTFSRFAQVVEHNPAIDKLYTIEKDLSEVVPQLRRERYNLVVDLHNNLRTLLLKMRLRRRSIGFRKLNVQKYLLVRLGIDRLPPVHIVDRYLETVQSLGVTNDGLGLEYHLAPAVPESIGKLLPAPWSDGFVAIVTGGRYATKIYPADLLAEVVRQLPLPVVLLGGPEDQQRAQEVTNAAPKQKVLNGCGSFSLHESAMVVSKAKLVITNDTGLMHIAAAFGKKIISVWGNTVPQFGMYPYMPHKPSHYSKIVEVKGLPCRPCSKIGYQQCPEKHFSCMHEIKPNTITETALQMLGHKHEHP